MIRNYLLIAWRNLSKNMLFSAINVVGLSIGICCCVLIYLYVRHELSYDSMHSKSDRICRVTSEMHEPQHINNFALTSEKISNRILANFPEVEDIVRIEPSSRNISYKTTKFFDNKLIWADSSFLDVFDFELEKGNKGTALQKPYSIVITRNTARRYFGDEDPYGKVLRLSDTINLTVTGVLSNLPQNSHLVFDAILSRHTLTSLTNTNSPMAQALKDDWFNCSLYTYLLLKPGSQRAVLEKKINTVFATEMADVTKSTGLKMVVHLQALKDIHLHSKLDAEFKWAVRGDMAYVYIFSATAILVLLIACSNFINLSTARSFNRSREIGLRKVIGARRTQLIFQFLSESLIYAVVAALVSVLMVVFLIPLFNSVFETQLAWHPSVIAIYLLVVLVTGLLAGLYPALLMSPFAPVRSLKGALKHSTADTFFRKSLVVFQFSIAIVLIAGSVILLKQLNYLQSQNTGLNREQVIWLPVKGADLRRTEVLRNALLGTPGVEAASLNGFNLKGIPEITLLPEGTPENEMKACPVFAADEHLLKVFDLKLVAGRNFSNAFATDATEAFIINECAVRDFGWKTPQAALGKQIEWGLGKTGKVIGVVKDFNYASLHENIRPLLIHIYKQWMGNIYIRLNGGDIAASLAAVEKTWKSNALESPFNYTFVDDDFNALYKSEQQLQKLLSTFTFLAIVVACLGLFGLSSFSIRQRIKEIGIRKVLGSGNGKVVVLLTKDFLKPVALSILIGIPVSIYLAHKWLQNFAYKTSLGWWLFASAGVLALLIAAITVSMLAFKAATTNPTTNLRSE